MFVMTTSSSRQEPDVLLIMAPRAGLSCFRGCTPGGGTKCEAAPLLPVLYVSMNLLYNISLLNLLRSAGKPAVSAAASELPHAPSHSLHKHHKALDCCVRQRIKSADGWPSLALQQPY